MVYQGWVEGVRRGQMPKTFPRLRRVTWLRGDRPFSASNFPSTCLPSTRGYFRRRRQPPLRFWSQSTTYSFDLPAVVCDGHCKYLILFCDVSYAPNFRSVCLHLELISGDLRFWRLALEGSLSGHPSGDSSRASRSARPEITTKRAPGAQHELWSAPRVP